MLKQYPNNGQKEAVMLNAHMSRLCSCGLLYEQTYKSMWLSPWTLTAELEKRTKAFEMRRFRRLLNSLYQEHVTNEEVRRKIQAAIAEYDQLLTLVKKRKLRWFGHVSRSSGLAKSIYRAQ